MHFFLNQAAKMTCFVLAPLYYVVEVNTLEQGWLFILYHVNVSVECCNQHFPQLVNLCSCNGKNVAL